MTGSQFYAEYIYNAFALNQLNAEFFSNISCNKIIIVIYNIYYK